MNTRAALSRRSARREAGFTMAEIAIALGVIAVALIAIIGILPAGLQGQRDTREETILNQDARLLLEAVRTGGRDVTSDLASYVVSIDGTNKAGSFATQDLIRLLSDRDRSHTIVFTAISGGIASRGTDLGFRYQVINNVTNSSADGFSGAGREFIGTRLGEQIHEVRLRFSWPVKADGTLATEANRYVVRTLVAGWHTNGVVYAQEFFQPATP